MSTNTTATPATAVTRTASEDALWAALTANPGATTAELAEAASLSSSAARKILNGWAAEQRIARDNTGDDPRTGFRWLIPDTSTPAPETDSPATESTAPEDSAPPTADAEPEPVADPEPAAEDAAESGTDSITSETEQTGEQPASEAAPNPPGDTPASAEGLCPTCGRKMPKPQGSQPGALRGLVEDYLREHPDQELKPGDISKALNRSSGAIVNALFSLVGKGVAVETCERPHTFKLHPDRKAEQDAEQKPDQAN